VLISLVLVMAQFPAHAQDVEPVGAWPSFKPIPYRGSTIRLHLLAGYGRAVAFPEPVDLQPPNDMLPGCDILIKGELVEIYPRGRFERTPLELLGLNSGTTYELSVRSSTEGKRRSVQIVAPSS